jgi:hypothetical protein
MRAGNGSDLAEAAKEIENFLMGDITVCGDQRTSRGVDGEDAGHAANAEGVFNGVENFVEVFAGVDEVGEGGRCRDAGGS